MERRRRLVVLEALQDGAVDHHLERETKGNEVKQKITGTFKCGDTQGHLTRQVFRWKLLTLGQ